MKVLLQRSIAALTAVVLSAALVGCGGSSGGTGGSGDSTEQVVLTIGATPVPHGEILKTVQEELAKENITLNIIEFTDYIQPNLALDSGELDANFFQHMPYLNNFNENSNTNLNSAVAVHFEPLGLFAGRTKSLADLPDGGTIAVPSDTTNAARALLLLEAVGLITMPPNSGLDVTPRDIVENPKNLNFHEIEAALVPSVLVDVDFGVVNGNYALSAGLDRADIVAAEDIASTAAQTFANIIAVRVGDESRPEIQALVKAVTSPAVKDFINTEYPDVVIPVFE